jgi:GT2 family glycosyltransferase
MACHNRRDTTLAALRALYAAAESAEVDLNVFIVDDLSGDGTGAAIVSEFPGANVIPGTGSLYWNGGMRLAWRSALCQPADFFLWLNDDLCIFQDSIRSALNLYRAAAEKVGDRVIVCGRTVDPITGGTSYGGLVRTLNGTRMRYRYLKDTESTCETFAGNFVLFPERCTTDVGINSRRFVHHWGDIDYGLRATYAGYHIEQLSPPVGIQTYNSKFVEDISYLNLANARFIFLDPKGVRPLEFLYFCRRHGGPLWILRYPWRYIWMILNGIARSLRKSRPSGSSAA